MVEIKCANHPSRDTQIICASCEKPICKECRVDVEDKSFCKTCVARMLAGTGNPGGKPRKYENYQRGKAPIKLSGKEISEEKVLGAICYLWFVGLIMLFVKRDNDFVLFHAKQATVLFGISIIGWLIGHIPGIFWIGKLILLGVLVACVVGFIKAITGESLKIPIIGDWAERIKIAKEEKK